MGFKIYEDTVAPSMDRQRSVQAGDVLEAAEDIFLANAQGEVIQPGTGFHHCALSLSHAYPTTPLAGLKEPAMEGRAWSLFDSNYDGVVSREEFLAGIAEILNPVKPEFVAFVERLKTGAVATAGKGPKRGGDFIHYGNVKRVGIVGAGVAGLQVAAQLKSVGMECVIFEKTKDVGGVWRENYADFGLQVPKELYEFPGFPYPKDQDFAEFPSGPQVYKYIQLYAKEFNLYDLCKFETAVLGLTQLGGDKPGWKVTYQHKGASKREEDFDFLVVATGMYGWPPHIPKAKGHKGFKGEILHSCTFTDKAQVQGKKVVTVGGGKSAVDNAVAAAKTGTSSVLLSREAHWPVPRKLANLVPFKFGTYSRFGHFMLHTHHEETPCFWWMHSTCAPVKWIWWRVVEQMFKLQFRLKKDMVPPSNIDHDVFNGGQILTYEFRDMIEEGKVKCVIGAIEKFKEKSVVLTDGTELEADTVIYATGFKKSYDLFDATFVQPKLGIEKDGLYLYRNVIPPQVPNLAFVGAEVSTFNNILTHGLQALWLRKVLTGEMDLPGVGGMLKTIEKETAWKRSWMPASSARASIWQLHMTKYHDNLMKDLGESHLRKFPNPLAEVFMPYQASDYANLFKGLKK